MGFLDEMVARAKSDKKTLVLAEGSDERTLEAAEKLLEEDVCNLIILGDTGKIYDSGYKLEGATVIDPETSDDAQALGGELYELRKAKGLEYEAALDLVRDPLYYGVMLVKTGQADGMVAGACHATADVLRPALQILKTKKGVALVSSFFVMVVPNCSLGENGTFIFADCGLEVQPSAERLAHIAIESARSWKAIMGTEPKVAMLSHSTHGSAKNDDASKVEEALEIAKGLDPDLAIDGGLQLDAALVNDVASSKCPDSSVAGKANVLIFPDLDAGNIGYKLVQRLANAEAYGPVTQGIAAPVNDLSRGCSAEDIFGVAAITAVQAQND